MSHHLSVLLAGVCLLPASILASSAEPPPFIYETPREFFVAADLDGNGQPDLVVVDKETGKYRLGYQNAGLFTWVDCRPSGIKGVTGFCLGPLLKDTPFALAFTSPDANQISVVNAANPAMASRPLALPFDAALGPNTIAAVSIGGAGQTALADLVAGSIYNSPDENLQSLLRINGNELVKVSDTVLPGPISRANVASLKPGSPLAVTFLQATRDGLSLQVEDYATGKPVRLAVVEGLAPGSDYIVGNFRGTPEPEFLCYKPGEKKLSVHAVTAVSAEKAVLSPSAPMELSDPVCRLFALQTGSKPQLLVLFGNGEKAGLFNFDGVQSPVLVQSFQATNEVFTAAAACSNALVFFSQSPGGKLSTRYYLYLKAGENYASTRFGSLPTLADNDNIIIPDIHSRIAAQSPAISETEMKPYTNAIPGTRATYSMVPIPGGEFVMGSPAAEKGRKPDEGPQHKVKISPFWMGRCEVTWNEYELFMYPDEERRNRAALGTDAAGDKLADAVTHPSKPYVEMSFGMGKDGFPAIAMTQHAASKYCQWLSAKTGHFYRLPTEAEWEYAARAGTTNAYFFGDDDSKLGDYAWFEQNSDFKYQKVGKKKPNPWGLCDIYGNVVEWVLDQYDPEYYNQTNALGVVCDPWNRATKPYPHSVRGGSWDDPAGACRSAARRGSDRTWKMQDPQLPKSIWYFSDAQFVGFRIVRPLKVPAPDQMQRAWSSGVERD